MYGVSFVLSPNRYRNDFGIEGEKAICAAPSPPMHPR
jgi:hypothetical protein